jgi:anti-anti-sigma factor
MPQRCSLRAADVAGSLELFVEGMADLAAIQELHRELLAVLLADRPIVVHLDAVERLDGAGLQLLMAAKAQVEARGQSFKVAGASDSVRSTLQRVGAGVLLGNPEKEEIHA